MSDERISICQLCKKRNYVHRRDFGDGPIDICTPCETGMDKAKARRIANLEKPTIREEDEL